jgi:L-ascorbate metabolism protein UlaG (beta-lactamase superfamily)
MRTLVWIVFVLIILIGGFFVLNNYIYMEKQGEPENQVPQEMLIDVQPVEHASAVITWGDYVIYTDPTGDAAAYADRPSPSFVVLTDIHGDHLSTSTLAAVRGDAIVIVPQAVQELLPAEIASSTRVMANGESISANGFTITAVPMYNLPEDDTSRHTKGRGNGYIFERDGQKLYIAGDTDGTPEMRALTGVTVALLPMNPPFTMSVEEAAEAVLAFKPEHVYPYHYRSPDGLNDVEKFKQLVTAGDPNIDVVLLNWYPSQ